MMKGTVLIQKTALFVFFTILLFGGCGGGNTKESPSDTVSEKHQIRTLATTITKGNYIDVAKFAYSSFIEQNIRNAKMDVVLPGNIQRGIPKKNIYIVQTFYGKEKLRKIVLKKYHEQLEIGFLDNNIVKIIIKMPGDSREAKMTFADFTALR